MLLRAVEHAKRGAEEPRHILWVSAEDIPDNPKELAKNPAQLQKQKERFLQFHDQKTSGIPGLLPLYFGMKARVTEKISAAGNAAKRKFVILKHTPCTVVGWELHERDRCRVEGRERLLNYITKCIFLKLEGVSWRIHKDLELGVFPLKIV